MNNFTCKNLQNFRPGGTRIEVRKRLGGAHGRLEASWEILGCLGRFSAVLGASWKYFRQSEKRLGFVFVAFWSRLGGVLGCLGASCGRLGGILCLIFSPKEVKFRHAILDTIFQLIFGGFCVRKSIPES